MERWEQQLVHRFQQFFSFVRQFALSIRADLRLSGRGEGYMYIYTYIIYMYIYISIGLRIRKCVAGTSWVGQTGKNKSRGSTTRGRGSKTRAQCPIKTSRWQWMRNKAQSKKKKHTLANTIGIKSDLNQQWLNWIKELDLSQESLWRTNVSLKLIFRERLGMLWAIFYRWVDCEL